MKFDVPKAGWSSGLIILIALQSPVWAEVSPSPFQSIIDRNVFHITPKPPDPPIIQQKPPPPAPKVVLTGIASLGPPRIFVEITEQEPGKPPSVKKPILRVGEREGDVEVLSIDVAKNMARIRNGDIETNLTFEIPKATAETPATSPGGRVPGRPSYTPPSLPLPPPATASASPSTATPTIISRTPSGSAAEPRTGISVLGATPATTASSSSTRPVGATGSMLASYGTYGGYYGGAVRTPVAASLSTGSGLNVSVPTPTRETRINPSPANASANYVDPVMQIINLNVATERAKANGMPVPPMPPIPGLDNGTGPPTLPARGAIR